MFFKTLDVEGIIIIVICVIILLKILISGFKGMRNAQRLRAMSDYCLKNGIYYTENLTRIPVNSKILSVMGKKEREYLQKELSGLYLRYYPSQANFILFRADAGLEKRMLEEKILIRSCANFTGLDESFYRAAIRGHRENEILISALRRCING